MSLLLMILGFFLLYFYCSRKSKLINKKINKFNIKKAVIGYHSIFLKYRRRLYYDYNKKYL